MGEQYAHISCKNAALGTLGFAELFRQNTPYKRRKHVLYFFDIS